MPESSTSADDLATRTLADLVNDHPAAADETLLYDDRTELSAGDARAAVHALADRLRALGVQPGQPVLMQLPNSVEALIGMLAIWAAGAVLVPLNHRAPAKERARVLQAIRVAAILDESGLASTDGAPQTFDAGVAFVTWTSGTTGPPKAIVHTHSGYFELLDRVLTSIPRTGAASGSVPSGPPNLVPVALALNSGIYNALFGLRAGRAVVLMDRFEPIRFAELIRRFGIKSTVLPPAAIAMLNDAPAGTDLAPLRYVRSITAPLSPVVARAFRKRFGVFVLNSYGQAEVGEVIGWSAADAREHPDKVGAAGRPHVGVDVKVVDDNGRPLGRDEVGQLMVRPPSTAAGYATGEDLSERFDAEGYLATGDLGSVDEEGFVWITGRLGEVIVRGGNKVYPTEVEDVLRCAPAVADAAVVAASDERLGELPVAFVADAPGVSPASDAELEALCREQLVAYKVPAAFHRRTKLPRNEIGKILRKELQRELDAETAG